MKKIIFIISVILLFFILYRGVVHLYLPEKNSDKVIIYTTDWCPYCKTLRNTLSQYDIPYVEYNTETSLHGLIGYLLLGGHGVPTSVIGDQVIYGYDGQEITDALVQAGHEIPAIW
jgi:glutaredoxin